MFGCCVSLRAVNISDSELAEQIQVELPIHGEEGKQIDRFYRTDNWHLFFPTDLRMMHRYEVDISQLKKCQKLIRDKLIVTVHLPSTNGMTYN